MKKLLFIFISMIIINSVNSEIIINEIMYNPNGTDNNKEFIEIKGTNNLSDFIIGDLNSNDTLTLLQFNNDSNFSIIVEQEFNYSNINCSIYSANATIGNGLGNTGDTIYLYFDNTIINEISYNDNADEGYSLERINSTWIQSLEPGGTPGRENTCIINLTEIDEELEISINLNISNNSLNLNNLLNIDINISSNLKEENNPKLTIKIARNISDNWKYSWYIIDGYNITSNFTNTFSWNISNDKILGNYKILATLKYDNDNKSRYKYSDEIFYINGLEDLGEHSLSIIKIKDEIKFGEITNILIKFSSNNYNFDNVSAVAYLYSPKWASIDFDDNTLRTKPYETNAAQNLGNIDRGSNYFISIPLLSKRNCENDFSSGLYAGNIRFYDNNEIIIEQKFNITLSGKNDAMCPKTIYKSSQTSSSGSATPAVNEQESNKFKYDDVQFEIFAPKNITNEFNINISITNQALVDKEFSLWSYVYSGKTALMDRKANLEKITINSNQTKTIILRNKITVDDIPIKEYKIMVKINTTNKKSEKTSSYPVEIIKGHENKDIKIKSFYTKAKNYNEKIKLFASCDLNNYNLTLDYSYESVNKKCNDSTVFEVSIQKGINVFFLSISDKNKIYDAKKLMIYANDTNIETIDDYKKIKNYETNYLGYMPNSKIMANNLITGKIIGKDQIIYQSKNIKLKKLINYLLPTIIILGIYMVYRRK